MKFNFKNWVWENRVKKFIEKSTGDPALSSLLKKKFPRIRVFGFDMISLTSLNNKEEGKKAHVNFLIDHDILILEDMNLAKINTTPHTIILSPLQIENADGVPCTVIANFD